MVATYRVTTENDTAGGRYVVDDNVGRLPLAAGHIREGDEPIEAILERGRPGLNCTVDCIELLVGGRRVGFDGDMRLSFCQCPRVRRSAGGPTDGSRAFGEQPALLLAPQDWSYPNGFGESLEHDFPEVADPGVARLRKNVFADEDLPTFR